MGSDLQYRADIRLPRDISRKLNLLLEELRLASGCKNLSKSDLVTQILSQFLDQLEKDPSGLLHLGEESLECSKTRE